MNMRNRLLTTATLILVGLANSLATGQDRVRGGLLALYDFRETDGDTVYDRSGAKPQINLRIRRDNTHSASNLVARLPGSLEVTGKAIIESERAPSRLIQAIQRSGEITIEAWIRPADTHLYGASPARIVTLSQDPHERDFTLGQDGDRFVVRLRTTSTTDNGTEPSLATGPGTLTTDLTHVVYTRHLNGHARIYLNGIEKAYESIPGDTSSWNDSFHLAFSDELTRDRQWRGTFYLVAIYGRALSQREVDQNFRAGAHAYQGPGALASDPGYQPRFERFDDVPYSLWEVPLPRRVTRSMNDADTITGDSDFPVSFSAVFEEAAHFPSVGFGRCGEQRLRDAAVIYEGMTLAVDDVGRYEVRMVIEAPRRPTVIRMQLHVHEYIPDWLVDEQPVENPRHRGTITLAPIALNAERDADTNRHETSHTYTIRRGGYSHLLRDIAADNEARFSITRSGTARSGSIPE